MGSTANKLNAVASSKEAIRKAIVAKGVACDKTVVLSDYSKKILEISSGGSIGLPIPGVVLKVGGGICNNELSMIQQPVDCSGAVGETAYFCIGARGSKLKYQWQWCAAGEDSWSNSTTSGNTTIALTVPITAERNGQMYRCVVTDGNGNQVISSVAKLTVE